MALPPMLSDRIYFGKSSENGSHCMMGWSDVAIRLDRAVWGTPLAGDVFKFFEEVCVLFHAKLPEVWVAYVKADHLAYFEW